MASSAAAGSRLDIPKNPKAIEYNLPKLGEVIVRQMPHKSLKDALMRAFGKDPAKANVEGKVMSIEEGGKTYRINWTIEGVDFPIDHGKPFFKVKKAPTPPGGGGGGAVCIHIFVILMN